MHYAHLCSRGTWVTALSYMLYLLVTHEQVTQLDLISEGSFQTEQFYFFESQFYYYLGNTYTHTHIHTAEHLACGVPRARVHLKKSNADLTGNILNNKTRRCSKHSSDKFAT